MIDLVHIVYSFALNVVPLVQVFHFLKDHNQLQNQEVKVVSVSDYCKINIILFHVYRQSWIIPPQQPLSLGS